MHSATWEPGNRETGGTRVIRAFDQTLQQHQPQQRRWMCPLRCSGDSESSCTSFQASASRRKMNSSRILWPLFFRCIGDDAQRDGLMSLMMNSALFRDPGPLQLVPLCREHKPGVGRCARRGIERRKSSLACHRRRRCCRSFRGSRHQSVRKNSGSGGRLASRFTCIAQQQPSNCRLHFPPILGPFTTFSCRIHVKVNRRSEASLKICSFDWTECRWEAGKRVCLARCRRHA